MSTNKHIHCTNVICICSKATVHAAKALSSPTFLRHRFANWTGTRGISGIDGHKTNTVLLCQHLNPCDSLPICPRSDSFTEGLASTGLLSQFQILQILNTNRCQITPWQLFNCQVDVVFTCPRRLDAPIASRLTATDFSTNSFHTGTVLVTVRIYEQLVNSNVNSKDGTSFWVLVRNVNPKRCPVFTKHTTLEQFGSWFIEPVIKTLMILEWNNDWLTTSQPRNLEDVVKNAFTALNLCHKTAEAQGSFDNRTRRLFSGSFNCLTCRRDSLQRNLKAVGAMSIRQTTSTDLIQSAGIQPARLSPEIIDVMLGTTSNFTEKCIQSPKFGSCGKSQRDFN